LKRLNRITSIKFTTVSLVKVSAHVTFRESTKVSPIRVNHLFLLYLMVLKF